ncbi:hypothetical protein FGIG_10040 [Fasciola gigantica]|uniref:Uncharacterized protein n=1 Tax=Fasciola gigantica TaxID=46835 RepID=A0A504YK96_FASGI|nr:hypothetical protein FGIG_10040 [Fasciola gigantica]
MVPWICGRNFSNNPIALAFVPERLLHYPVGRDLIVPFVPRRRLLKPDSHELLTVPVACSRNLSAP